MQVNHVIVGPTAFVLGGIVSFVLFGPTNGSRKGQDTRHTFRSSEDGVPSTLIGNRPAVTFQPSLSHDLFHPPDDRIDRNSLRQFLSVDLHDLTDSELLMEWGLSEEAAMDVSAAYADTIAAVRKMEADLTTVETDNNGGEYLLVSAHAVRSRGIIATLEKHLEKAFPIQSASHGTQARPALSPL